MKHRSIRGYFIAGLLVWLPLLATFVVLRFLIDLMDISLSLIPSAYQPEQLLGTHVPGIGLLLSLIVLFVTGIVVTNFLGRRLFNLGEAMLSRIPLVRSIYYAVKQVLETIFSTGSQSFRQVLLVEYPRKGMWSLAFQTGGHNEHLEEHIGKDLVTIFIPTTPNPTSGFLMMLPRSDTILLDMSVDEAIKMVISLGVVKPIANLNPDVIERNNNHHA
jgi:uncharacterized membrane protein